jgi:hypothetical protein
MVRSARIDFLQEKLSNFDHLLSRESALEYSLQHASKAECSWAFQPPVKFDPKFQVSLS